MRFLDLAVAALIGSSGLIFILAWNPATYAFEFGRLRDDAKLNAYVADYVESRGLVWLQGADLRDLCADLSSLSNSSLTLSGSVGPSSCGPIPPANAASSSVALNFDSHVTVIEAWYVG